MRISALTAPWCWLVASTFLLAACDAVRPTVSPIPMQFYPGQNPSRLLVIFLPGLGDDVSAFDRAGFVDLLFDSAHSADAVAVDAHLGYYLNGSINERVYRDVLVPYERKGYSEFLIVGVSLGGLGALKLRRELGDCVSGVVLMAPFLGNEALIATIEEAGGVQRWEQQLDREPDLDESIWIIIHALIDSNSGEIPHAIIGFGRSDKFARANRLLGRSIPEAMTFTADGSHNWSTWRSIWADILQSEAWKRLVIQKDAVKSCGNALGNQQGEHQQ